MLFIFRSYSSSEVLRYGSGSPPVGIDQILRNSKVRFAKIKSRRSDESFQGDSAGSFLGGSSSIEIPNDESSKSDIVLKRDGTGPTVVGYVNDFRNERQRPLARALVEQKVDAIEKVVTAAAQTAVKRCSISKNGKKHTETHCSDLNTTLFAYNSAWFPRILCGQEVMSGDVIEVPVGCEDYEVGLSTVPKPPVSGDGMDPIVIKSSLEDIFEPESLESVHCDVPCKQQKDMQGLRRFVAGEQWTITFTDADAFSNGNARLERLEHREDHFYSTQSFKSSVPHTFFNWSQYSHLNTNSIDWLSARNKAVYLVDRSCSTPGSRRHKYFSAMSAVVPVDSYGLCGHNIEVPHEISIGTSEGRVEIMKKYRVVLAFDPSTEKDHISPMIWDAIASGSVPVVVGAENMRSHLPEGSFVWSGDFSNWDELANHVKELLDNKSMWESYHTWRSDERVMSRFSVRYEFARTSAICRLCRWSYAKKYGLGWNDERQEVSEPSFRRRLCVSGTNKIISTPFQEAWFSKNDQIQDSHEPIQEGPDTCGSTKVDFVLKSKGLRVDRKVSMHDSVVDITLKEIFQDASSAAVVLRLTFPGIENIAGAHFKHTHRLVPTSRTHQVSSASMQDGNKKVTVMLDWVSNITSPSKSTLEVVVMEDSEIWKEGDVKRVRIVLEDFDAKNEKESEFFPSAFCKKMIKDFSDPLHIFFAAS
ncbi:unnamed protein product [Cylindrotheca closterium]|uniref:Fucosyltransferase n=1 Tax=Cylindrotheca closterium TaxID=2856 RepID=A0AAD2PYE7_9STRA|nr:unnamed protein product [Cylindrotheca closterium]